MATDKILVDVTAARAAAAPPREPPGIRGAAGRRLLDQNLTRHFTLL